MYSFTVKYKVFQILTYIRQERPNEQYRNTVKDLLLPDTVSQKDEKPHTAGLDDTVIPHIKCICHSEPTRGMKMKITDFDENWCD